MPLCNSFDIQSLFADVGFAILVIVKRRNTVPRLDDPLYVDLVFRQPCELRAMASQASVITLVFSVEAKVS